MTTPDPDPILRAAMESLDAFELSACDDNATKRERDDAVGGYQFAIRRLGSMARRHLPPLLDALDASRADSAALRELVSHCWVHNGYPDCGYRQMTTEQKKLYCQTIGADFDVRQEQHFGKAAADAAGGGK